MKRLVYIFTLGLFLAAGSAHAQISQDVSFVHGLNETPNVWDDMAGQLAGEFVFNHDNVFYNDAAAISTAVAGTFFPANTVTVAHSLGGLLSREYLNQNGTSAMKALVTVGAPNTGAPVADAIQTPVVQNLSEVWYERLLAGPLATIDIIAYFIAHEVGIPPVNLQVQRQSARELVKLVLRHFGISPDQVSAKLASNIKDMFGNDASVDDMRPGSAFLTQLNDNPETTLPAARYAIYGSEDLYGFVRLFSSFQEKKYTGNPMEDRSTMTLYYVSGGFWLYMSIWHAYTALQYRFKAIEVGVDDPDFFTYQDYSFLHSYAARQWLLGFVNFATLMPAEWRANITKSLSVFDLLNLNLTNVEADDALLAKSTQAPAFFNTFGDGIDRRLPAEGANHLEETVHPSVKERLLEIFETTGIKPVDDGGVGGDPIDPPPDPCTDNDPATICPQEN